jgi:DinB superfamily
MDHCDECGFTYDLAQATTAGSDIVEGVGELTALLGDPVADLTSRREPGVWSPLEYACHVRDVLLVQRERVLVARRTDVPTFDPMGRDERVEHDGYGSQAPADVSRQLGDAALMFDNALSRLASSDWERTGIYNWPAPAERSLRWVAAHTLHEVRHHLLDVHRQLG